MVTVSPPVSPSVVARILMIQKPRVISGTLVNSAAVARMMRIFRFRCGAECARYGGGNSRPGDGKTGEQCDATPGEWHWNLRQQQRDSRQPTQDDQRQAASSTNKPKILVENWSEPAHHAFSTPATMGRLRFSLLAAEPDGQRGRQQEAAIRPGMAQSPPGQGMARPSPTQKVPNAEAALRRRTSGCFPARSRADDAR